MGNSQEQYALLTDYDTQTAYSEAIHTLYANICFSWKAPEQHAQAHTLLITACSSSEAGIAANLAIVAAQSGVPTILVDADLRSPTLQQRFGLEKKSGLSNLLLQQTVDETAIETCLQTTFVPGLRLLGAGTAIEQGRMHLFSPVLVNIIEGLRLLAKGAENQPGIVIFHSPPVEVGADASLIAAQVEQTILTVIAGRTTREQAAKAQEQLQQAHATVAGVVMLHL
ncbi:MAG TPA: CpsD/CapB family tyrosine-protein kinase [Ktedonobacteraceae bacterium]|nr:CpsD/CapB family tyrosine-protein kinase [Ktedonobacteraceae bacterium]